ncbi:minor capsid protein [Paenibacillus sp. FSL R10-2734]|uniref:minor capsid protein n=1 Tax=Paenibacillus sp. FSL R10-2734 TaxID=2954691 RepID=UPI0030D7DC88
MRSEAYWSKRMERLNESLLNKGVPFTKSMNKEYRKAQISIQTDVNNFYQRFADNNGIVSLSAAKQVLKAGELKEFKWTVEDYIARGKENAIDQRWMKELENASIRVRVTRLESIQLQMKQHVEELSAKRLSGTTELLGNVYKDGYYRSIFELEKGIGIGASFSKVDKRQLEAILSAPWAPDGSNFSSRIWTDRVRLNGELRNIFTQGLIRGDTSKQMVQQLQDRLGVSRKNAERLILTESAYFAGQSRIAGYKELGVEQYRYTATLDSRTSITCRDLDGKVFDVEDAQVNVNYPPMHAYCRSTTIPHYDDNIKERVARDDDGKTYEVPEDIAYPEWEEKYAPEASEAVTVEVPSKKTPETPLPTIEIPGGPTKDIPIPQQQAFSVPTMDDFEAGVEEPRRGVVNRKYNPRASYFADLPDVTDEVLERVADINREVARSGYKEAKEIVVMLDKTTGEEIARLTGSVNKVAFTEEVDKKLRAAPSRSIILTHNHPRGTRVNVLDSRNLANYLSVQAVIASGHNGGISFVYAADSTIDSVALRSMLPGIFSEVYALLQKDKKYATMSKTAQDEYFDYQVILRLIKETGWGYGEDFTATKRDPRIQ